MKKQHLTAHCHWVTKLLAAVVLLCCAALAQDKPIALKGGKLLTVSHGTIENGTVVLQGGKITAVGPSASVSVPPGPVDDYITPRRAFTTGGLTHPVRRLSVYHCSED